MSFINMKKLKRISRSQKRIIIVSMAVLVVFLAVWGGMYVPTQEWIDRLKKDLDGIERQIREIEAMITDGKEMGEGIRLLEGRYQQLISKFPSREETALTSLFDLASRVNMEITSIRSQVKRLCRQPVTTEGKSCYEVPLSLELRGSYQGLVEYIGLLRESLPAFITFEKINIYPGKSGTSELSISLEIQLYLLA